MSEEMDKAFENVEIYRKGYEAGYEATIESLQSQWISVDERLPEDGQHVLSVDHNDRILRSTFLRGNFKVLFHCDDHKPATHWMPLPSPPEVKK